MGLLLVVILIIGLGLLLVYFNKKNKRVSLDNCDRECLIKWFKKDEILKKLKSKNNYIAIVIKDTHPLAKNIKTSKNKKTLIQCVFDEKKNVIIDSQILECKNISIDIEEMFGDKDMVVLN